MKREMNVKLTTLVGILVLGIASTTFAEAVPHDMEAGAGPGRPGLKKAVAPADQPQYSSIINFPKDNGGKEVELSTQPILGETLKTKVSPATLEGLSTQVEIHSQLRGELKECKLEQDPAARRLVTLFDQYHVLIDQALRGVKEADTNVVSPKTTDIRQVISVVDQIQTILAARKAKLANDKAFATAREEKISKYLDESLKLFLSDTIDPIAEKAKFGLEAQLADKAFAEEVQKTLAASREFAATADADVCSLGAAAAPAPRRERRNQEVAEVEQPVEEPKPVTPVEPTPVKPAPAPFDPMKNYQEFLARLDRMEAQRAAETRKQGEALLAKATKDLEKQAEMVAAEQERQARIAKMDDEKRQQALKADLEKLKQAAAEKDKQGQKQQPMPAPAVAASPGGGGSPAPQQQPMDPMGGQQPQQDPNANWMAQMAQMMGMGQSQPQPTQPQIINMGPSPAWNDIYNSRANRIGAVPALPDGTQGALQAQNALLNEIRMGQMQQGGVPNAYQGGMYGPQQQLPLSQRLGQVRSTGRTGVTGSQVNGISGTNLLATGRTRTVPVEISGGI